VVEIEEVGNITEKQLLAAMVEESGHVGPPPGSFTVEDYIAEVRAQGGHVSYNTALEAIMRKVDAGTVKGRKLVVQGRQRWVFWPANNHDEKLDEAMIGG